MSSAAYPRKKCEEHITPTYSLTDNHRNISRSILNSARLKLMFPRKRYQWIPYPRPLKAQYIKFCSRKTLTQSSPTTKIKLAKRSPSQFPTSIRNPQWNGTTLKLYRNTAIAMITGKSYQYSLILHPRQTSARWLSSLQPKHTSHSRHQNGG